MNFIRSAMLACSLSIMAFVAIAAPASTDNEPVMANGSSTSQPTSKPAACVSKMEFIFNTAPFPSCHASTIVETKSGTLITAFFGGTKERDPDVGIWVSRLEGDRWSTVTEVANGIQPTGPRLPTWNPVLFQPKDGPLMLFYKVGPKPADWWGMVMTSTDDGKTWSKPEKLPDGILGPVKDKPIQLADGAILSPSSTENNGWQLHIERSTDNGKTWTKSGTLNDGQTVRCIQPTLLDHGNGNIQLLCRSRSQKICEAWSSDAGRTWSEVTVIELPNPNSGIDAVQLKDGRSFLVYNHTSEARVPLNLNISLDGKLWGAPLFVETADGQLSYPSCIQTSDGMIHIVYTWNRKKIRHVVVDPKMLP